MAPVFATNPALNSVPGKIIMKGTSKISLQDRFARLSKDIQRAQAMLYNNDVAVSAANKRLAQELGNRPEVVAALRDRRKPLTQRLGVRARLGVPIGFRQRVFQQRNGISPVWPRNAGGGAGQIAYFNNVGGIRRPRFGPKRFETGRVGASGGFGFGRGGMWKRYRGGYGPMNRGGIRRGSGVGGGVGGFQNKQRLSREELDRQLDEYMAKTKSHLDDDLDAYMGDATV